MEIQLFTRPLNLRTETVKALIERGANLEAKDNVGRTALQIAIKYDFQDVVNVLKEYGAKDESCCTIS